MCFDRDGQPISLSEFAKLRRSLLCQIVARDKIGRFVVMTVWLGVNQDVSSAGPATIFRTSALDIRTGKPAAQRFSATEDEAVDAHWCTIRVSSAIARGAG